MNDQDSKNQIQSDKPLVEIAPEQLRAIEGGHAVKQFKTSFYPSNTGVALGGKAGKFGLGQ